MTLVTSHVPRRGVLAATALAGLFALPLLAQQPPNDNCANPLVISTASLPYTSPPIDTRNAFDDSGDPAFPCLSKFTFPYPANAVTKSVWFTFTPVSTDNYTLDTLSSTPQGTYDTVLGVYTGICGNFVPVASGCNDDSGGSPQSKVDSVALNSGTTYYILVAGIGSRDTFNPSVVRASDGGTLTLKLARVSIAYPYSYVVPSIAHVQGLTLFVSDVFITNMESTDANYQVQFLGHGNFGDTTQPSSQPVTGNLVLLANGSREFPDILQGLFGLTDFGALLVKSTKRLYVGAKTFSPGSPSGTYGQYTEAVDLTLTSGTEAPLQALETGKFNAIRSSGAPNVSGNRTNFVLFNNSAAPCTAHVDVRDQNGSIYANGSRDFVVPPNTSAQANDVKGLFGITSDIAAASLVVRNQTTGCKLTGAAYVIDNVTQDPFTVPLRK